MRTLLSVTVAVLLTGCTVLFRTQSLGRQPPRVWYAFPPAVRTAAAAPVRRRPPPAVKFCKKLASGRLVTKRTVLFAGGYVHVVPSELASRVEHVAKLRVLAELSLMTSTWLALDEHVRAEFHRILSRPAAWRAALGPEGVTLYHDGVLDGRHRVDERFRNDLLDDGEQVVLAPGLVPFPREFSSRVVGSVRFETSLLPCTPSARLDLDRPSSGLVAAVVEDLEQQQREGGWR